MIHIAQQNLIDDFVSLYKNLIQSLPHLAVHNFRCENSDYSDQLSRSRNAYLCFNGDGIEDCYYTYDSRWNKNCVDMSYSNKCELCYECIDCDECYYSNFCQDCERCSECVFCYDCFSCQNCFGCVGLRQARFSIFNKSYTQAEYVKKIMEVKKLHESKIRAELEKLREKHPHVNMHQRRSENCFGDYVFNSKNSQFVFKVHSLLDCLYISNSKNLRDCLDCDMTHDSELCYEAIEDNQNYNCNFIYWCADLRDCEYTMYCFDCENCFGCFNLKRKKYHILNEPYEKDAYFETVKKIKEALRQQKRYTNFLPDIV